MHIHEYVKLCNFSEGLGTDATFGSFFVDCTERLRELLLKVHPKQFLISKVEIPLYEVKYSYRTKRGNEREGTKYFFSSYMPEDAYELEIMAEGKLQQWVASENIMKPYRAIDNVKILSVTLKAKSVISFE